MSAPESIEAAVASVTNDTSAEQLRRAVSMVSPEAVIDAIFGVSNTFTGELLATGLGVSPGTATGRVARSVDAALDLFDAEHDVILVMDETNASDEVAMRIASGIVTSRGGLASHAAVVARDLGVPAICGVGSLDALADGQELLIDGRSGEVRSVDGANAIAVDAASGAIDELPESIVSLLEWADRIVAGRCQVLVNADRADAVARGVRFGARGVGLCRIEHIFLGQHAPLVAAVSQGSDTSAFERVLTDQLVEVLRASDGRSVVVRLLDAPAHEFGGAVEHDPMLGLRGIRAALTTPGLAAAQVRAIRAAHDAVPGSHPRIMVPLVSLPGEMAALKRLMGDTGDLPIGVMIETPRAALCADRIAAGCAFVSFGTNDLTQLTYGWGRDDLEPVLVPAYRELGIIDVSPFESLDEGGVARLIALAAQMVRAANPAAGVGACGEHAGDPRSIEMLIRLGVDSVSCSAYRVPLARLAVAQAYIAHDHERGDSAGII